MDIIFVTEMLKIAFMLFFIMDSIALMYVWAWKEYHYQHRILFFPIPFTGIYWLCSDYEKIFKEMATENKSGLGF